MIKIFTIGILLLGFFSLAQAKTLEFKQGYSAVVFYKEGGKVSKALEKYADMLPDLKTIEVSSLTSKEKKLFKKYEISNVPSIVILREGDHIETLTNANKFKIYKYLR